MKRITILLLTLLLSSCLSQHWHYIGVDKTSPHHGHYFVKHTSNGDSVRVVSYHSGSGHWSADTVYFISYVPQRKKL